MFYQEKVQEQEGVSGIMALTPAESKRLIAKSVAALPEVRHAMKKGRIIIGWGTTNAFVAEELLGLTIPKIKYAAGIISEGQLQVTPKESRIKPYVLCQGKAVAEPAEEVLKEFDANDVFIKGANAIDIWGNAGILMGSEVGGTIGGALPILIARGSHLIVPVGLEKLIPSVIEASKRCGIFRFKYSSGAQVGFMPLVNAQVVTEIQALKVLTGVTATHVASGGIGGSEGAVVLTLEGTEEVVARAFDLVKSIKGEAPVPKPSEG